MIFNANYHTITTVHIIVEIKNNNHLLDYGIEKYHIISALRSNTILKSAYTAGFKLMDGCFALPREKLGETMDRMRKLRLSWLGSLIGFLAPKLF